MHYKNNEIHEVIFTGFIKEPENKSVQPKSGSVCNYFRISFAKIGGLKSGNAQF